MTKYVNPHHASYVPPPKPESNPEPVNTRSANWDNPAYKNKAHCFYCQKKLKKAGFFTWAIACRKCGRIQPWAVDPTQTPAN